MTNDLPLAIILQLVGVVVIIAEIILPSGGILSILAVSVIGYSIYSVFVNISATAGAVFVLIDIITIPILVIWGLKMLAKSPVTLRKSLASKDGVSSQSPILDKYMDGQGSSVSDLRPAGVAVIDGDRVDVVTRGEYIEKNTLVEVIAVKGNQIIVKQNKR